MIRIIADAGVDIEESTRQKYDIEILPNGITADGQDYTFDGDLDKFYEEMKNGVVFTTSQVSLGCFLACFEEIAKNGQEAIYISLSSGITGGYASAVMALNQIKESYKDVKIKIVNSKSATFGYASLLIRARMMEKEGLSYDEIVDKLEVMAMKTRHVFTVGTLDYLYRGGRISKTAQVFGGLLNIRPILDIEKSDGSLKSRDKAKGKKQTFKKFLTLMDKNSEGGKFDINQTLYLAHADWKEELYDLKDYIVENTGMDEKNIIIGRLGVVIGSHTGPELLVAAFLDDTSYLPYYEI